MTYGGEVGADLVGAAGNEPDLQQRANIPRFFHGGDSFVPRFYGYSIVFLLCNDSDLIRWFIFYEEAFQGVLFFCFS